MPRKNVVTSPIPADLQPAVDDLIRKALVGLPAHIAAPISLDEELAEVFEEYQKRYSWNEPTQTFKELKARVRPLPESAYVPELRGYQLCQQMYRHRANTSGKLLAVPELLGFADMAVEVSIPGEFTVRTTAPYKGRSLGLEPDDPHDSADPMISLQRKLLGLPEGESPSKGETHQKYDFEVTFSRMNQWWRYVVAPQGSGIASTFQRLQQLRAWAVENDIYVVEGIDGYILPNLGPAHFGVISDDEELCRMAKEQGFRRFLVTG